MDCWAQIDCIPVITLRRWMPDGKLPPIRVGLLNSYEAHPRCNLTRPWSDSSPVRYNSKPVLPRCSRNNCFAVTLAVVEVSCCTSVPFCQLKGYLDLLTVTKRLNRGQTLHTGWMGFWRHILQASQLWQEALCDSPRTEQCVRHFLSDVYCLTGTQRTEFWGWLFASQLT